MFQHCDHRQRDKIAERVLPGRGVSAVTGPIRTLIMPVHPLPKNGEEGLEDSE